MNIFGKLSIKYKLILLSLSIGLGSIAVIGWLSVTRSSQALLIQQEQALEAIRTGRQGQIEDYFGFIHEQIFNFAQNRMVTEATAKFSVAFAKVAEELDDPTEPGSPVYQAVKGYYTNEFKPRLEDADQPWRGADTYVPQSRSGRLLQDMYIARNPHDVGDKLSLDRAEQECEYNRLHAIYHPRVRDFLESFGYYDIFLFDLQGNLIYSVFKETDYATSFLTGPYKDTNFGDVYRQALNCNEPGTVFIEDFKYYEPSYGAPASFTASPVFHDGEKVGVAIFQMPVDKINHIMSQHAGMGESGEAYLVGSDRLMRSNSRFSEEPTISTLEVATDATAAAISGKEGMQIVDDYRGVPVVSSYSPLKLEGLHWVILAEMDLEEVMIPASALRNQIVIAGSIAAAVVAALALFFSLGLVRPIYPIVERAGEIAAGDLTGKALPVRSKDEIGQLTVSMNEMSRSLSEVVTQVAISARDVATASTEIAASSEEMSQGMGEQSEQVTQVSAAIEEMSASVVEVARKSGDAANNASQSGEVAQAGGDVVEQTIEGMRAISEAVSAGAASVAELGKRGEQIGKIIDVINDIADQTNLLALNAAIEAARAGEHGRGFAVVADEVRKLADRTTKATDEIGESIKAIQTETSEAVKRMNAGTDQVAAGVESATEAGQSLKKIVTSAQEVAGMIQSIAAAAEQQSAASEEVSKNISTISAISDQANEGARQSAEAVSGLSQRAAQLQTMLGRFKLASDVEGDSAKWYRAPDQKAKILVVDDDPSILRVVEHHLKDYGELTLVGSGQQAVSTYRSMMDRGEHFDLVCMDIMMPDLDGRQAVAQIRNIETSKGVRERRRSKIIMISALDTPQDKLKSFRESCDAYVTKPIDKNQLLEVVDSFDLIAAEA